MRVDPGRESRTGRITEDPELGRVIFSSQCSWLWQDAFLQVPGVVAVLQGYIGGYADKTACVQVSAGNTRQESALQILFDLRRVSDAHLLSLFLRIVHSERLALHQQATGPVPVIFYHDERQRDEARLRLTELAMSGRLPELGSVRIESAVRFCPVGN